MDDPLPWLNGLEGAEDADDGEHPGVPGETAPGAGRALISFLSLSSSPEQKSVSVAVFLRS